MSFYYFKTFGQEDRTTFPHLTQDKVLILPFKESIKKEDAEKLSMLVNYVHLTKPNKVALANYFERVVDAVVYEMYLTESIQKSKCEVLKHLNELTYLKTDWSEEKKLQAVEKIYVELSNSKHPVTKAIDNMDGVEEIRIIEGKQ
jgi:hypothetical protein